jgi:hypothetical protein
MPDRYLLQLVVAIVVGLFLLYETETRILGWNSCAYCYHLARLIVLPGLFIGWIVSGVDAQHVPREAFYIGVVVEFTLLWLIWYYAARKYARMRARSRPQPEQDIDADA